MFYLKYRPQKIAEIDSIYIRETLGKALLLNNWSHAYLLTGPKGSGKTSTARLIAKIVNCQTRKKGEDVCGECASCQAISQGKSLDVFEIDAASNRGIDEIRALRERVKLATNQSAFKVYIIDEVHMLTTEAFNALLKTLEEPPEHVIFVLATTEEQKVPGTIASRCQVFRFSQASVGELLASLGKVIQTEHLTIEPAVLKEIAESAEGSFRDAQKLLEQFNAQVDKLTLAAWNRFQSALPDDRLEALLGDIIAGRKASALKIVGDYVSAGGKVRDLYVWLISRTRDWLLSNSDETYPVGKTTISKPKLEELIKRLLEAFSLLRDSPIPSLPLELVISEFEAEGKDSEQDERHRGQQPEAKRPKEPIDKNLAELWQKVLTRAKESNHSLTAVLRGAYPKSFDGEILLVEVLYRFHKERLEEAKNRGLVEKIVADIMDKPATVKFVLKEKHGSI